MPYYLLALPRFAYSDLYLLSIMLAVQETHECSLNFKSELRTSAAEGALTRAAHKWFSPTLMEVKEWCTGRGFGQPLIRSPISLV